MPKAKKADNALKKKQQQAPPEANPFEVRKNTKQKIQVFGRKLKDSEREQGQARTKAVKNVRSNIADQAHAHAYKYTYTQCSHARAHARTRTVLIPVAHAVAHLAHAHTHHTHVHAHIQR